MCARPDNLNGTPADRVPRKGLRETLLALVLAITPSAPTLSYAGADPELENLIASWKGQTPWCPASAVIDGNVVQIEFASKNEDKIPPVVCNDGDSIVFNGLMCLAGVEPDAPAKAGPVAAESSRKVGCDVVKYSQTRAKDSPDYGRWWRSPRRVYLAIQNQQPEGGSETTFSNDHALGVMAYIAATRDVEAFLAWTQWIRDKAGTCQSMSCIRGLPRYCPDDRCGFKIIDCPLLDRLGRYLGVENAACASDSVKNAQGFAFTVLNGLLIPFNAVLPNLKDAIDKYGAGKEGAHTPERIAIYNSIINDLDYPLHSLTVTVYILRKFGLANPAETQMAADIAYRRAPDNPFFEFVATGATPEVRSRLTSSVSVCPKTDDGHPKFQWTWERQNIPETAKKTMYWDCVFLAKAFLKGDYPPATGLPSGIMDLAQTIASARSLVHSPCAKCNADCSGRDIDCDKPFLEKIVCEANKKQVMWSCEAKKTTCLKTCS